jgi:hypothetical protein
MTLQLMSLARWEGAVGASGSDDQLWVTTGASRQQFGNIRYETEELFGG